MSKHSDDKAEKQKKDKETVAKNDTRPLVLIVEDNADVAEYMSMQLRKRYQLAIAKDGEEGLRLATETVPDLIITDLMMPRMDGYALCQAVKQAETLNHIPVIIVTAKTTQEDKLCGLQMGVDAVSMICRISPRYSSSVLESLHRNIARKNSLQAVLISERPSGNAVGNGGFLL